METFEGNFGSEERQAGKRFEGTDGGICEVEEEKREERRPLEGLAGGFRALEKMAQEGGAVKGGRRREVRNQFSAERFPLNLFSLPSRSIRNIAIINFMPSDRNQYAIRPG